MLHYRQNHTKKNLKSSFWVTYWKIHLICERGKVLACGVSSSNDGVLFLFKRTISFLTSNFINKCDSSFLSINTVINQSKYAVYIIVLLCKWSTISDYQIILQGPISFDLGIITFDLFQMLKCNGFFFSNTIFKYWFKNWFQKNYLQQSGISTEIYITECCKWKVKDLGVRTSSYYTTG